MTHYIATWWCPCRALRVALKPLNRYRTHTCTNADARLSWEAPCATREARPDAASGGDPTALTMRVMAEAVEPRARVYIYAHENRSWENRDKLRRRHAAQLQDQSSGNWLVPRMGPRCAGVLWASLVPTTRRVQSCSCHLKACHHSRKHSRSALRGDASTMEEKRRCRAASDCQSRASSHSGRRHRFAPPEAPPAVAIGPAVAPSVTMASTAHLADERVGRLIAAARP